MKRRRKQKPSELERLRQDRARWGMQYRDALLRESSLRIRLDRLHRLITLQARLRVLVQEHRTGGFTQPPGHV